MKLSDKKMLRRYEQVSTYSVAEYRRRLELTRRAMREADVTTLVIFDCAGEAYDAWLTGEHNLCCVYLGEDGPVYGVRSACYTPVGRDFFYGAMEAPTEDVRFLDAPDYERLARELEGKRRVGVVNSGAAPAGFMDELRQRAPRCEVFDLTIALATEKSVKSAEEREAIAAASRLHERVMRSMPQILRQGRPIRDIGNDITRLMIQMGSGNALIHAFMINYGPSNGPAYPLTMEAWPGRRLLRGDRAMVLLETNGPGGHCTALGRFFSLGEPDAGFVDVIDMTIRAQKFSVDWLRPGVTLREIVKKTRAYIEGEGYETNDQCYMHGLGGNLYEQYAINDITFDVPLKEGAFLHAHPVIKRRFPELGQGAVDHQFILDAFFVSPEGGVRADTLLQKLFIIE